MIFGHFALRVVVLRAFEEETQEALCAVTAVAGSGVDEQHEVEAKRGGQNRIAAEEVDFHLHGVAHPTEDVDVVPAFLAVAARRIVVDAHLVVVVRVEVGLLVGHEDAFEGREFGNLLRVEVGRLR